VKGWRRKVPRRRTNGERAGGTDINWREWDAPFERALRVPPMDEAQANFEWRVKHASHGVPDR
jgi:hypothetical protein